MQISFKLNVWPSISPTSIPSEVVVQSAAACQSLLEDEEILDSLRSVSRGLEQAKRGEGQPMREFLESLGAEFGNALK